MHEDVENFAVAVHGAPQPVLHAVDHDHHLVQVPFVGGPRARSADPFRDMRPEFPHPCPDRLIAHHDTAFGQQILDITQAKREAIIRPDRVGNDGARKAVAFQARCGNLTDHRTELHNCPAEGNNLTIPTRGIVLLLLYLGLDDKDDRPLLIDQPEENLDPKSVFDELVQLFTEAKSHRQVIMVTHNANLVINTDADQIIIAEAGPHPHNSLPPITYVSGGLENAEIRKMVCDILEGGAGAFQERARRLRVRLDR